MSRALHGYVVSSMFGVALLGCGGKNDIYTCPIQPLSHYRGSDAVALPLRFENRMGPMFRVEDICISVDGQSIRQPGLATLMNGFNGQQPLMVDVSVRAGVRHTIKFIADFAGRDSLNGYRFALTSSHAIEPSVATPETVVGTLFLSGGPSVPIEQRPTVSWSHRPANTD